MDLVIKELPSLVMYLLPGYLVLWSMGFTLSTKIDKDNHIFLKSIIISYIIINISSLIIGLNVLESLLLKLVIMVSSVIIGFLTAKLLLTKFCAAVLRVIGVDKSIHNYFLNDIIDKEHGILIFAYLPNEKMIYKGEIRKYEEKDDLQGTYFLLSNYVQYNYDGEELVNFENENNRRVLLSTKDVSRIELFYHPESKRIL